MPSHRWYEGEAGGGRKVYQRPLDCRNVSFCVVTPLFVCVCVDVVVEMASQLLTAAQRPHPSPRPVIFSILRIGVCAEHEMKTTMMGNSYSVHNTALF